MFEFTDRYGGNYPSGLRVCGGNCEGMGVYPTQTTSDGEEPRSIDVEDPWVFVTCEECHGTGNTSWLQTVARIPRWIVKGLRFTFIEAPKFAPDEPLLKNYWMGFKCSFLADLKLWRP